LSINTGDGLLPSPGRSSDRVAAACPQREERRGPDRRAADAWISSGAVACRRRVGAIALRRKRSLAPARQWPLLLVPSESQRLSRACARNHAKAILHRFTRKP
jgi:hypothetical protein